MESPERPIGDRRPVLHRVFGSVPGVRWLVGGIAGVAIGCAVAMRVINSEEFPTFGRAFWWAIQTVTTVGYGDVTPQTTEGRLLASLLMIAAVATISLLTATIAAGMVNRVQRRRSELQQDPVIASLERIESRLEQLERRLGSS
jgi:voltage-gated potassium channel